DRTPMRAVRQRRRQPAPAPMAPSPDFRLPTPEEQTEIQRHVDRFEAAKRRQDLTVMNDAGRTLQVEYGFEWGGQGMQESAVSGRRFTTTDQYIKPRADGMIPVTNYRKESRAEAMSRLDMSRPAPAARVPDSGLASTLAGLVPGVQFAPGTR